MKNLLILFMTVVLIVTLLPSGTLQAARYMENLDRGVVVVRSSSTQAFISWRLLGLDPAGISFNLYRSESGGPAVKLNSSPLTAGTCYTDTTTNFAANNAYYVKPVIDGVEQGASGSFTLAANAIVEPCVVVPLGGANRNTVHFVWVGDLDGDGEYEYVLDRLNVSALPQQVEAYDRDGTLMWSVDLGVNSTDTYNIEPGSATIDVGHWDGVTVYDFDDDGKAEVAIRTANGVTFGNGAVLSYPQDNNVQFISMLDGMTGAERARIQIPTDYLADGPMGAQLGVGYLDGVHPSLVAAMKNRIGSGDFNMMVCAWDFNGTSLTQKWKWLRGSGNNLSDGHQMRIVDVNGDGMDEIGQIGFVLNGNGTVLYNLWNTGGVMHGDRWHIGEFDLNHPGLEGYGIQQTNPSGLLEYYYDAATGAMLWQRIGTPGDVARGDAGDVDASAPGYECWAFNGMWNLPSHTQLAASGSVPWPCLRLWWDGDDLTENYNDGKIEKWNPSTQGVGRLVTTWNYETATRSDRGAPMFYGDIFGDWREEAIHTSSDYSKLVIFTTTNTTSRRLYTLAHNPEYRNCMTVKGYIQSNQVDYYLGSGMSTPPAPNIVYVGSAPDTTPPTPDPMTWATVPYAVSTSSISMVATTASDASGVEYYFTCTLGGGHDSGWQASTSYTDTGLTANTLYTYRVIARDLSANLNETGWSVEASATTFAVDTTPPTPNPMTFATAPYATGQTSIAMVATTASDVSGVEYLFTCTAGGGHSSAWQASTSYTDTGLTPNTMYTYTVTARDLSVNQNQTAASAPASATTPAAAPTFVAAGAITSGTGTIAPALPAGIASGDILLLFVETANQTCTISNQNGGTWTAVTGSPQGTGTAGGTSATMLTVFWSRYNGSQGAPTVSDSGNHTTGGIAAFRNCVSSGNPWDVTAGLVEATADTSGSIPGATTTVNNTLVVVAIATALPDATNTTSFSAWTNAGLTSLTERIDNARNSGNGGAIGIAMGVKATAGAYGNTAVTLATSSVKGMMSIALKGN